MNEEFIDKNKPINEEEKNVEHKETIQKKKECRSEKIFDIRDRTIQFGIRVIKVADDIPKTVLFSPIMTQFIKSGTAIGANIWEGDGANSRRDFVNKLVTAREEAKETRYWLKLLNGLRISGLDLEDDIEEVQEIIKILSAIIINTDKKETD